MVHMVNLLITMYMEEGMLQETVTVVRLRTFHSTFLNMDHPTVDTSPLSMTDTHQDQAFLGYEIQVCNFHFV